jgi:3-methylcrotonyl-CoA carboxylase alpha subunit
MANVTLQPAGSAAAPVEVEWEEGPGGAFTLALAGQTLEGQGSLGPDGEGVLRIGSRVLPFFAVQVGTELHLWLEGEVYRFARPQAGRTGPHAPATLPPGGGIPAPMPGQVLKVLVEPGGQVEAQAPLVLMESMKMQLTLPAPTAGTVAEVLCKPGQMVDLGDVLLRLEEEATGPASPDKGSET